MNNTVKRILFISNGHGEDLNASAVLRSLQSQCPTIEIAALPIVGEGKAYRKLGIPIVSPTRNFPSGGFVYMSNRQLWSDIWSGLPGLLLEQLQALKQYSKSCDFVFATGDVVVMLAALLSNRPFGVFLVSSSSFYEGKMQLPFLAEWSVNHQRCQFILTRDRFSAEQLQQQGKRHAQFLGYPIMDVLVATGEDLRLITDRDMVALLPGSRLPEAAHNFRLQLQLAEILYDQKPLQFCAALVPDLWQVLPNLARSIGWELQGQGKLWHPASQTVVQCFANAFADILQQCNLVIGMAGTAVEQAVGLGKPVIQIPGQGPQFTYRFAEAQNRLLGLSVRTIGKEPANSTILQEAAQETISILSDQNYQQQCIENAKARVGAPGGSEAIAALLARYLRV